MYEENDSKIEWALIIKKILIVIVAILVIFGIITLITKCAKGKDDKPTTNETVDLNAQLDELEEAVLGYLTKENLPTELNASKTIRLKILINKELLTGITDSEGNKCDADNSYAEVTRLEETYAVKMSLTCGSNNAYRIIYVGCFEDCEGDICKGTATSTGGTCSIGSTDIDEPNTDNNTDKNTSTNTNTSSQNNKPSSSTSNNNSNSNSSSNNNSSTPKTTYYEYKRCTTTYTCENGGTLNKKNQCVKNEYVELTVPFTIGTRNYTQCFTSAKKNTSTTTYQLVKYDPSCGYTYNVVEKTYNCEDPSYSYISDRNVCAKMELHEVTSEAKATTTCETTWNTATSLAGWTRTGNTK